MDGEVRVPLRLAVDTGGTFTDLVVRDEDGRLSLYKSPTTPDDPIDGVLNVLQVAADQRDVARQDLLQRADLFIHGTTRAINAILTKSTAKTAFLTTEGHPGVLLFREGRRPQAFDYTREYPEPYVPLALTYEVPERVDYSGSIVRPLDEDAVVTIIEELRRNGVEAVAVCFLWSIANASHELRVGELLAQHLPDVPFTLSHALNPALREYRRASSAAIDASLKPIMTSYLHGLRSRLEDAGFLGRVLVVTSGGGMLDAEAVAAAPIHAIMSGPALAPVAGRHYADIDAGSDTAVIADTGGTSYDVTLVRRGRIPWTRESWLGQQYVGHMTGFPSIDVKSIGAGGGSIAWVDEGGLLHVGPASAGAVPGPVCYGRGGTRPTVTDAALALGYIDAAYFLGGAIELDAHAAREALERDVGSPLGLDYEAAAAAVLKLMTEHMVRGIEEITVNQGVDPRSAVLVGGGGAAGLNIVEVARRLGSKQVVLPQVGAALSAAGALMADLTRDYTSTFMTTSDTFDYAGVNAVLAELEAKCREFAEGPGSGALETVIEFSAEARYPHQIWELDVPLAGSRLPSPEDVERLRQAFHAIHSDTFGIDDRKSPIEVVAWHGRVRCRLHDVLVNERGASSGVAASARRTAYFAETGSTETSVYYFEAMRIGEVFEGPGIVESPVTTVVVNPGATVSRTDTGSLLVVP